MSLKLTIACNTIHFPTNKGVKQEKIKIELNKIAVKYPELGIYVLKPAIDRLTFSFTPNKDFFIKTGVTDTPDEIAEYWKKTLYHDAAMNVNGLSLLTGVNFKKPPYKSYNVLLKYAPSTGGEATILVGPKNPGHGLIRVDMYPSQLGIAGMKRFRELIEGLLAFTGTTVPFEDFLIWSKIFRADVAVDILGARPGDMDVKALKYKAVNPQKHQVYKSASGRTETIYPALKKGTNTDYVYDKRMDALDKGQPVRYGDVMYTRFESRILNTGFFKLAGVKNRCNRLTIRALDFDKFWQMPHDHRLFIRYAMERDLKTALALIPENLHTSNEQSYASAFNNIWQPTKIWEFWPEALKETSFFDPA